MCRDRRLPKSAGPARTQRQPAQGRLAPWRSHATRPKRRFAEWRTQTARPQRRLGWQGPFLDRPAGLAAQERCPRSVGIQHRIQVVRPVPRLHSIRQFTDRGLHVRLHGQVRRLQPVANVASVPDAAGLVVGERARPLQERRPAGREDAFHIGAIRVQPHELCAGLPEAFDLRQDVRMIGGHLDMIALVRIDDDRDLAGTCGRRRRCCPPHPATASTRWTRPATERGPDAARRTAFAARPPESAAVCTRLSAPAPGPGRTHWLDSRRIPKIARRHSGRRTGLPGRRPLRPATGAAGPAAGRRTTPASTGPVCRSPRYRLGSRPGRDRPVQC